ncbi:lipocalin family protein [Melioribacter sp. OK-6-Me]|uniref:lipocalin family protein n=1 Tax=unclassified Melioribacter TaxID=2627329 RepID=UPI003EDA1A3D
MKNLSLMFLLAGLLFAQNKQLKTVDHVDINKYAGLWYEIAKIQNKFQDDCIKGTTALYTITEDGKIKVVNSCIDKEGELDKVEGVARIVDKKTNSKLEVSFFSILGWRPVWGDYWIIGLDKDYKWAIVGTPSRKYGWILSRTPELENKVMEQIFSILKQNGYNPNDFIFSNK